MAVYINSKSFSQLMDEINEILHLTRSMMMNDDTYKYEYYEKMIEDTKEELYKIKSHPTKIMDEYGKFD